MKTALVLADRTAVLFLGIAAGVAIGYAFGSADTGPPPIAAGNSRSAAQIAPPPPVGPLAPAAGATAAGEPQQFAPHLLRAIAAGEPVTVGVFGDSFGDGVWTALYRLLPSKDHYRVLKFSRQSTGFTRYGRLNLRDHAERQIAEDGPVDVAVISFGANDTQGIYADGHAARLMSPEWQRVVGERVDAFVALMRQRGIAVYWLGLPKMRAAAFDADIAAMNDFYRRRMAALGVPFIDVHPLTVDPAGNYTAYLPDPVNGNEPRLLRANDGVHMSMNGYIVITRALAGQIRDYVAAATRVALPGGAPEVVPEPAPPTIVAERVERPRREAMRRKPVARPEPDAGREDETDRARPAPAKTDATASRTEPTRDAAPAAAKASARPAADTVGKPAAKPATDARKPAADTAKPAPEPKKPATEAKKPAAPLQLKLPPPEPETATPAAPATGDRR